MPEQPWNINIHYDRLLDSTVPPQAQRVLDVGCGDGFLAARLCRHVPHVTAVDADALVLQRARARFADASVEWVHGDIMAVNLPTERFDAVVSNATLHHLDDTRAALRRFASLVHPGGTLAVATFVKPSLREAAWHIPAWIACLVANRVRGKWEHSAPIKWPPPETLAELRDHVRATLPAARVRRLLYNRVLITWQAPA